MNRAIAALVEISRTALVLFIKTVILAIIRTLVVATFLITRRHVLLVGGEETVAHISSCDVCYDTGIDWLTVAKL